MITSKDNEKLKLVRSLARKSRREQENLFVSEGEDLLDSGLAAGWRPKFVLCAAGSGLDGEEVDPELLASVSTMGSGSRVVAVWPRRWAGYTGATALGPVCVYLHGVSDPGNVGTLIRSMYALVDGTLVLGPGCADPFSPKAVRASMGSIFAQPLLRGDLASTPKPRLALVAHGGSKTVPSTAKVLAASPQEAMTVCLGAEREGLPDEVLEQCEFSHTIRMRQGAAESLNVAAAGAIVLGRISESVVEDEPLI